MSKFRVGQRVRIVGAFTSMFLIGTEATVVGIGVDAWSSALGFYKGIETDAVNFAGNSFIALPDQLEPATDSYDVVSWESCAWKPEHLRVEA